MDKIRIYSVAQELGIPSQELLAYFEENGHSFFTHFGMIDADTANRARAYFAIPDTDQVETVLSPATAKRSPETAILDFVPFQVEVPEPAESADEKETDLFIASQEAVAKVEQKVAAATQAPIRQSLLSSMLATASVAVAPTFVAFATLVFGQPNPRPLLAILLSIALTAGAIIVGSAVWATQPESAGFSFGDLMLWSWVRREAAERTLIENTAILGFDRFGRFLGNSTASQEEQMRAVREIAGALDAKSSYTLGHSRRVEKHVRKVAEAMGLSDEEITDLTTAAALHDIGNIQIPDALLRKTGELTIEERDAIEAHVLLGARMVLKAGNDAVVDGIRHHHERWDGAGYPDGMAGEEIPRFARLIGIAEAYDAMTSTRPYRQGFGRDHAVEVLRAESGLQFDGDLVEMFVSTLPKPLLIIKKFPILGRVQQQIHELQLLFKRMGAVAISATASTIAIALLLGGTVLSPGTSDAPDLAEKNGRVTPIDRVLAGRLETEHNVYDSGAALSSVLSPRESALVASAEATKLASLDGDDVVMPGGNGPDGSDPGEGPGPGPDPVGPGPGTDPVGPGPVDAGPGGGTVNPGPETGPIDPGKGGGGETPPPTTPPPTTPPPATPSDPRPGNSGDAPGHDGSPGNSANAPGHNKGGSEAPGNSGNAPGQNKGEGEAPGNSGAAPGQNKPEGEAPGNSGNSGSSNAGGNSDNAGGSNAGGNSDNAPGNSGDSNGGGSGGAGLGAGAGAEAAPGNSGDANGGGKDTGGAPATPGSAANENAGGKLR